LAAVFSTVEAGTGIAMTMIEPIHEFIDVLTQLSAAAAINIARQEAFQIGGGDVHYGQPFAGLLRRRDYCLVLTLAMLAQDVQRPIGVATNRCVGVEAPGDMCDLQVVDVHEYSNSRESVSLSSSQHRQQYRIFFLRHHVHASSCGECR